MCDDTGSAGTPYLKLPRRDRREAARETIEHKVSAHRARIAAEMRAQGVTDADAIERVASEAAAGLRTALTIGNTLMQAFGPREHR